MEYEIHFAAEAGTFNEGFRDGITTLKFRDDNLVGQGVVFPPNSGLGDVSCPMLGMHVTWDTLVRDEYIEKLAEFEALLKTDGVGCVGYAHAEVIRPEWDVDVEEKPFDSHIKYPVDRFAAQSAMEPKKWDIHISARVACLDKRLQQILFDEGGMYYIDLRKPNGSVSRVFTIQGTNSVREGLHLFGVLKGFVQRAGGMSGAVKFEQTCYWAEYGKPQILPPTIDSIQYKIGNE